MNTRQVLYRSAGIPAMQNKLFPSQFEALNCSSVLLELVQDESGLVYNKCFNSSLVSYDTDYQNDQGFSSLFKSHLDQVSDLCCQVLANKHSLIVDVGCGKGGFVELLRHKGYNAIGYDNAYQGTSPYIRKSFFSVDSHEIGELLILRHVLEHIPSPWEFLKTIAAANHFQGFLYIEVPDLEWILDNKAYFDLFHEHVNYFRISDFLRFFGASVVTYSNTFGGQYLSVIIDLKKFSHSTLSTNFYADDTIEISFSLLSDYENGIYRSFADVPEIVIWGASSKGVIFAAKAPSSIKSKISCAIDINPSKQGFFMPISGVQVLSPNDALSTINTSTLIVIMNPNYEEEIKKSLPLSQAVRCLH